MSWLMSISLSDSSAKNGLCLSFLYLYSFHLLKEYSNAVIFSNQSPEFKYNVLPFDVSTYCFFGWYVCPQTTQSTCFSIARTVTIRSKSKLYFNLAALFFFLLSIIGYSSFFQFLVIQCTTLFMALSILYPGLPSFA